MKHSHFKQTKPYDRSAFTQPATLRIPFDRICLYSNAFVEYLTTQQLHRLEFNTFTTQLALVDKGYRLG